MDEDEVATTFLANPSMFPREIAIELVDQAFITETGSMGMSAVKLSTIQDLIDDIDGLANSANEQFSYLWKTNKNCKKCF